jgi:hypothetical protein
MISNRLWRANRFKALHCNRKFGDAWATVFRVLLRNATIEASVTSTQVYTPQNRFHKQVGLPRHGKYACTYQLGFSSIFTLPSYARVVFYVPPGNRHLHGLLLLQIRHLVSLQSLLRLRLYMRWTNVVSNEKACLQMGALCFQKALDCIPESSGTERVV